MHFCVMNLRFAIVGCGSIAHQHAIQINKFGKLLGVCDIDKEKAISFAKHHNSIPFYSLHDLLNQGPDFDILVICTPNGLHFEQTIQGLQKNKHVLCEKPLCFKPEEAVLLKKMAVDCNRNIWVVKQNRFNPSVLAVKKMLTENHLGQIYSFQINCFWNRPESYYRESWRGTQSLDGGILYTQFSHFIDLLYWFLGDVKNIHAVKRNYLHPKIEIEDCGHVIFEMENNATGTMNFNTISFNKNMEGSFTLFGEKGTIKIGGEYLNLISYYQADNQKVIALNNTNRPNEYENYQGSMNNHQIVYQQLIEGFSTNNFDLAGVEDGLKTAEIISMIYAKTH